MRYLFFLLLPFLGMSQSDTTDIRFDPEGTFIEFEVDGPWGVFELVDGAAVDSKIWTTDNITFDTCGHWVQDTIVHGPWVLVDSAYDKTVDDYNYYYSELWEYPQTDLLHLVYYPCGYVSDIKRVQFRICDLSGRHEKQFSWMKFRYVPRPVSSYQKTLQKFNKE